MNELALFAGAGGGILGGHLLGWRTVCAVEWEPYPASVLCARQNDKILPPFPVWDDVQTFDGKPWAGIVDVVSGGFPCQDISAAGKGAGIEGPKSSMWKHMARIIGEVRPQYVYVENSPMLVTRGLDVVLADLAALGFDARWGVVSAADVGANHKRERIWIKAKQRHFLPHSMQHGDGRRQQQSQGTQETVGMADSHSLTSKIRGDDFANEEISRKRDDNQRGGRGNDFWKFDTKENDTMANTTSLGLEATRSEFKTTGAWGESEVADTDSKYAQGKWANINSQRWEGSKLGQSPLRSRASNGHWWDVEPNVGRVAHGVAARVDRLKAIGNGQVPEVARTAWGLLK